MRIPRTILVLVFIAIATSASAQPTPSEKYDKARWHVEMAGNMTVVDVILDFQLAALMVVDKASGDAMKSIIFLEMSGAEYSYGTTPNGKKSGSVSRLLRLSSPNRHWLVVRTPTDFTQLELDPTNYKQILTALETKMRRKVTGVWETSK